MAADSYGTQWVFGTEKNEEAERARFEFCINNNELFLNGWEMVFFLCYGKCNIL